MGVATGEAAAFNVEVAAALAAGRTAPWVTEVEPAEGLANGLSAASTGSPAELAEIGATGLLAGEAGDFAALSGDAGPGLAAELTLTAAGAGGGANAQTACGTVQQQHQTSRWRLAAAICRRQLGKAGPPLRLPIDFLQTAVF